ncbi:hypothetical protein HOB83_04545 [Candidatus Woesearchaeota archaeon]|nr:hypothetical protein [Candidatus Woesearchaeota archaeon]MBT4368347.1 hypothetical protein [Candidatus Woesearchaeota archaeon]MBT4712836.1 hypothetical protein [Candidatus Woesearchaeota archaeon]MBT6639748.1 hypothetical protein [Candidatus Woesearchaeota archaeon]MBT7497029.1 hypothetical protein [Candidatus Woesearchaeota archaeon]
MAKTRKKTKVVVKKKTWVKIMSPDNRELGECHIEEPKNIIGRRVKVNLMNFLNDPKKRKYNVSFIVTNLEGTTAKTKIFGYETQPTSIKMAIRKNQDRVDDRYALKTKDATIIIKPLMITRRNVTNSVKTALRKACHAEFKKALSAISTEEMFKQLIIQRIQRETKKALAKVYPLKAVEIKKATIVLAKEEIGKKIPVKEAPVEEAVKAPVKEEAKAPVKEVKKEAVVEEKAKEEKKE